jgi:hypothetical protein
LLLLLLLLLLFLFLLFFYYYYYYFCIVFSLAGHSDAVRGLLPHCATGPSRLPPRRGLCTIGHEATTGLGAQ